ncbi:MAG: KpsF/GutQ family sugar-phosphate isomerase [Candidatus Omnitrophica bacterium]|nr:KpsF/GutQ family sugar-phosphate isomerase [Candidatus Omnitrophota bacterium]
MKSNILKTARQILEIEASSILRLSRNLDRSFEKAIELMAGCRGRIILSGMGKPGFIARKIAATLASTGSPSLFLHPAEAIHGDLGMVTEDDVMIAISNSGETDEIVKMLSTVKKIGIPLIALTSNSESSLARYSDVVLNLGVDREACPLNLAPSASTTAALAMGDALALCLLKKKGFQTEDFAMLHPGGSLGKKLLKVKDLMRSGKFNPTVLPETTVRKALLTITSARAGSCSVVDKKGKLLGIFTDGDLRRHLRENGEMILKEPVKKLATLKPLHIQEERLAAEALHLLKTKKIDELPVVDKKGRAVGLLDVQDLLKAGFV